MVDALGITDTGAVDLNLDTLIGSHLCIQANSGAGKSGAIRKVLELTHGRVQHIIIDTEDEFYTLREKYEYLIAGGDNGDCAATVNNARALAMTILETGFSAIVQINSLPFDDRCTFIREFLEALTGAPKRLWRPVLVVMDEAQFYAPQKGYATSLEAIVSFMMLGRKRGFTGILATPRPADLSKQATSPVNNWMIGRCGQPADRRSAADALGFTSNSAEARNLRSLVARQFWVFGPALTNEPVLARIEKTLTTIVKAGQATLPTPPAPAAMQAILASLNAAAAEKPNEEAAPTASNEGAKSVVTADPKLIEAAERRGYVRGASDMAASAQKAFVATRAAAGVVVEMLEAQIAVAGDKAAFAEVPAEWRVPMFAVERPDDLKAVITSAPANKPPEKPKKERAPADPNAVPPSCAKLIAALARLPEGVRWQDVCLVAGLLYGNGYFYAGKRWLIDNGYALDKGETTGITRTGLARAGGKGAPVGFTEIIQVWRARVKPHAGTMLEALARHGDWLTAGQLSKATSIKPGNGHWYSGISAIRDPGLIEQDGDRFRLTEFVRGLK